jgi:hypothetical protein
VTVIYAQRIVQAFWIFERRSVFSCDKKNFTFCFVILCINLVHYCETLIRRRKMDLNSLIVSCVAAGQALLEIPTSFSESEEVDNIGKEEIILLFTKRRNLQVIVAGYTAKQFQQKFSTYN